MGDNVKALQERSVTVLANLVPQSEKIENALFRTPRKALTENVVQQICKDSVKPYSDAWQFYKELVALFEAAGGMKAMSTEDVKRIKRSLKA